MNFLTAQGSLEFQHASISFTSRAAKNGLIANFKKINKNALAATKLWCWKN
jgi:hypothetical protein